MNARQIIEARLGRTLPPTKDLPRDLRDAIRLLGHQLLKARSPSFAPLSDRSTDPAISHEPRLRRIVPLGEVR